MSWKLLASIRVGDATCNSLGDVMIEERVVDGTPVYKVYVNGGMLPDGSDHKLFDSPLAAWNYAQSVGEETFLEEVF